MNSFICGNLNFNDMEYKFDYRNDILVIIPNELEDYSRWNFNYFLKQEKFERINVEGITNMGQYICFIHVKFSNLGRGILQAFVPGYIIGDTNNLNPLPKCENIEEISFYGDCINKFYFSKKNIGINDILEEKDFKITFPEKELLEKKFIINKDEFVFKTDWELSYNRINTNLVNIESFIKINFYKQKSIDEIVEYFLNLSKFFEFINNRKIVNFSKIKLYKHQKVRNQFKSNEIKNTKISFDCFFKSTDEKIDLNSLDKIITLDDLDDNFKKTYINVTKKNFSTAYYPLSIVDNRYIDNDKFINVSSAFESEFDKLYPKFKSSVETEYKEVKEMILKSIDNKRYREAKKVKNVEEKDEIKHFKKIISECKYFHKIIKKIDGTLSEKINYAYKQFSNILEPQKQKILKKYDIKSVKIGTIVKKFIDRRNSISHGYALEPFDNLEIVGYELIRIVIYCITFKRSGFSNEEKIKELIERIF